MKLSIVLAVLVAGLCGQAQADVNVVGKNGNNYSSQSTSKDSVRLSEKKPYNNLVNSNCKELEHISKSIMHARINGAPISQMQAKANDMYTNARSPVKGDKFFNYTLNKVIISAYAEKNIPSANDVKGREKLKNNFSHNQKQMCILYLNQIASKSQK